jgi:hypothetical protein
MRIKTPFRHGFAYGRDAAQQSPKKAMSKRSVNSVNLSRRRFVTGLASGGGLENGQGRTFPASTPSASSRRSA